MFCSSCGAKLEDGAGFCSSCGAAQGFAPTLNVSPGQWSAPLQGVRMQQKSKVHIPVPAIIGGAVLVIAVVAVVGYKIYENSQRARIEEYYNSIYTKDEFNQMMEEMENQTNSEPKSIGGQMVENYLNSVNGEESEEDKKRNEELEEKLKNSSSPWFKDVESK